MTQHDKAPGRIWAWNDETPTEKDKSWSACDAGTGSVEYVRADLITAQAEENRRLREALKDIASTGRCEFSEVRAVLRSTEASHD